MNKNTHLSSHKASIGLRLINYIVDQFLGTIFAFSFMLSVVFLPSLLDVSAISSLVENEGISLLLYYILYFTGLGLYYIVPEYFFGKSFAKFITGTTVVSTRHYSSPWQIVVRTLARAIPFEEFLIFRESNLTLHDQLSGTMVVVGSRKLHRFSKNGATTMAIPATLAITTLVAAIVFTVIGAVGQINGDLKLGSLRVPQQLPQDARAASIIEKNDGVDYYTIQYRSSTLTFNYIELIAGYQFNPREDCVYNRSTTTGSSLDRYEVIPQGLDCSLIGREESLVDTFSTNVYKITPNENFPQKNYEDLPEYYFENPPHRYVIDVIKGELSDEEVLIMAKSMIREYPDDIKQMIQLSN